MASEKLQFIIEVDDQGSAQLRRFRGELDTTGAAASKLFGGFSRLGAQVVALNQGLELAKKALGLVNTAYAQLVAPVAQNAEQMLLLSRRFGTSVADLNSLSKVAKSTGVDLGSLAQGIRTLNLGLAGLRKPGSDVREVFDVLGLKGKELSDLLAKGPTKQMEQLIDLFSKFRDSPQRFAAIAQVFGRAAPAINQIANASKAAREELKKFEDEFGAKLSAATQKRLGEAADNIGTNTLKIQSAIDGLRKRIVSPELLEGIANTIEARARALGSFFKSIPQSTIDNLQRSILGGVQATGQLVDALAKLAVSPVVIKSFETLSGVLGRVADAIERISKLKPSQAVGELTGGGVGTGALAFAAARAGGFSLPVQLALGGLAGSRATAGQLSPTVSNVARVGGALAGGAFGGGAGALAGAAVGPELVTLGQGIARVLGKAFDQTGPAFERAASGAAAVFVKALRTPIEKLDGAEIQSAWSQFIGGVKDFILGSVRGVEGLLTFGPNGAGAGAARSVPRASFGNAADRAELEGMLPVSWNVPQLPDDGSRVNVRHSAFRAFENYYNFPPGFLSSLVNRESGGWPEAFNANDAARDRQLYTAKYGTPGPGIKLGAVGLGQFLASTGRDLGLVGEGFDDRTDPNKSVAAIARYIDMLRTQAGGDLVAATSRYNGSSRYGPEVIAAAAGFAGESSDRATNEFPDLLGGARREQIQETLRGMREQVEALIDPAKAASIEARKLIEDFEKLGGKREDMEPLARTLTQLKIDQQVTQQFKSLVDQIVVGADPTERFAVQMNRLKETLRATTPEAAAIGVELQKLSASVETAQQLGQLIANLRGPLQEAGQSNEAIAGTASNLLGLAGPAQLAVEQQIARTQQLLKDAQPGSGQFDEYKRLADQLERAKGGLSELTKGAEALADPVAAALRPLQDMQDALAAMPELAAGFNPVIENLKKLTAENVKARETSAALRASYFSLTGAVSNGMSEVLTAVVQGTRKLSDVFEGLKVSIVRSLIDAFKQGIVAKLGFDKDVTVNIAGLVKNIGGMLTGSQPGSLGGIFKDVFGIVSANGEVQSTTGIGGLFKFITTGQAPGASVPAATTVAGSVVNTGGSFFSGFGGGGGSFVPAGSLGPAVRLAGGGGGLATLGGQLYGTTASFTPSAGGGISFSGLGEGLSSGFSVPPTFGLGSLAQSAFGGTGIAAGSTLAPVVSAVNGGVVLTGGSALTGAFTAAQAAQPFAIGSINSLPQLGAAASFTPNAVNGAATASAGLLSYAALALALGLGAKGIVDTRSDFSALTRGTANTQQNQITALQSGILAGSTIAGAAVGTAVMPGVGTVVGAGVGAATGAAISDAIGKAINRGIAEGLSDRSQRRTGVTQASLEASIAKRTADDLILNILSGGANKVFIADILGPAFAPDIEKILTKIFQGVLGQAGVPALKEASGGFAGLGISSGNRAALRDPALQERAFILSQLVSGQIGAGIADAGRLNGFRNMVLAGSGLQADKENVSVEEILNRVFRRVFDGRLGSALLSAQDLLRPAPLKNDREESDLKPGQQRRRARDEAEFQRAKAEIVKAFQPAFPDLDVGRFADALTSIPLDQKSLTKSRKAVREAAPLLLTEGVSGFTGGLIDTVRETFANDFARTLARSPIGDVLGGAFQLSRKSRRALRRKGIGAPGVLDEIQENVDEATAQFGELFGGAKGAEFLKSMAKTFDIGNEFALAMARAVGDVRQIATILTDRAKRELADNDPAAAGTLREAAAATREANLLDLRVNVPLKVAMGDLAGASQDLLSFVRAERARTGTFGPQLQFGLLLAAQQQNAASAADADVNVRFALATGDRRGAAGTSLGEAQRRFGLGEQAAGAALARFAGALEKLADDIDLQVGVNRLLGRGDRTGAQNLIEQQLAPFRATVRGFEELGLSLGIRADVAVSGGGIPALRAQQRGAASRTAFATRDLEAVLGPLALITKSAQALQTPGGLLRLVGQAPAAERPALLQSLAKVAGADPRKALELLQEFTDARQSQLEGELQLARTIRDTFRGIADTFGGFRDQIDVARRGPRAQRDILSRRQDEIRQLLPAALGPEGEDRDRALGRISSLVPQLLGLAGNIFGPGSASFNGILDFVESLSAQIETLALSEEQQAILKIGEVKTSIENFATSMQPIIDYFTSAAQGQLQDEFTRIYNVLGGDGDASIRGILAAIARANKVQVPLPPGSTPTGVPFGEGFGGAPGSGVTGSAGGTAGFTNQALVQVTVQGASDPKQTAAEVAEALRTRAVPELIEQLDQRYGVAASNAYGGYGRR